MTDSQKPPSDTTAESPITDAMAERYTRDDAECIRHAAVEVGIEAASEAVSALPAGQKGWDRKEYLIAETAARAAVTALWDALQ